VDAVAESAWFLRMKAAVERDHAAAEQPEDREPR
jgi:hypothetical protein